MRRYGIENHMKTERALDRGKRVDAEGMKQFIDSLARRSRKTRLKAKDAGKLSVAL